MPHLPASQGENGMNLPPYPKSQPEVYFQCGEGGRSFKKTEADGELKNGTRNLKAGPQKAFLCVCPKVMVEEGEVLKQEAILSSNFCHRGDQLLPVPLCLELFRDRKFVLGKSNIKVIVDWRAEDRHLWCWEHLHPRAQPPCCTPLRIWQGS